MRRRPPQYPDAYVGDRSATIWSTTAQVRQTVATLHYGERVAVVRRTADQSQIRTNDGIQGWIDNRLLMDPELWRKSASLLASVHDKPIQASGRTRTLSNVRLEPGRDAPRIFQFGRGVPVAVYERKSVPVPVSAKNAQAEESPPKEEAISPDEDQAKARGLAGEEKERNPGRLAAGCPRDARKDDRIRAIDRLSHSAAQCFFAGGFQSGFVPTVASDCAGDRAGEFLAGFARHR